MIRASLLVLMLAGCALTSKSKPLEVRYFSLETTRAPASQPGTAPTAPLELKLGRVSGPSHIKDELVYRDDGQELGFYAGARWVEAPQDYVRRALTHALFQTRGLRQVVAGPGLTLDVELDTFEERRSPARVARVDLTWRLRNEKVVLVQRTVTVERPIEPAVVVPGSRSADTVATALASALGEALERTVNDAVTELGNAAATPPQ